jgi:hypothetical protein
LVGSIAGYSLIQDLDYYYLFGAVFVPFIWATGLVLGTSLAESLQFNRKLSTLMLGAVIGSLPLAILAAIDQDPEIARQGLLYGVLGALLSGSIMAGTLYLAQRLPLITNAIVSVAGAAIAGLTYSLVFAPLVSTADIPGFNIWSLAGILAGGSVSMMLGLLLVPVPPSRA